MRRTVATTEEQWGLLVVAGAASWIAAPVQFLLVHLVVQSAWPWPYSWATNNVSDLGNVSCRLWDGRPVCSPLHVPMNVSFVMTGVLVVAGIGCLSAARRRRPPVGQCCLGLAAAGWVLVGLAPADVDENLHLVAAIGLLLVGNLSVALLAADRRSAPWGRAVAWAGLPIGVAGLTGAVLFALGRDLGLGPGGMERVAAYGMLVWMVLAATTVLRASATRSTP